jgi:hypothetical protein
MRRLIPILFVAVGCSVSQPSNTTTLAPLVTTTTTTTTPQVKEPLSSADPNMAFLLSLTQSFGNFDGYYSPIEALLQGQQYCLAARGGMTRFTITDSINEGAETTEEIRLELNIVTSALTYLCPDQEYRINP